MCIAALWCCTTARAVLTGRLMWLFQSVVVWLYLPSTSVFFFCNYDNIYYIFLLLFLFIFFQANSHEIDSQLSRQFCPPVLWHCWLGRGHIIWMWKWIFLYSVLLCSQQTRNWPHCTDHHESAHQNDCAFRAKKWKGTTKIKFPTQSAGSVPPISNSFRRHCLCRRSKSSTSISRWVCPRECVELMNMHLRDRDRALWRYERNRSLSIGARFATAQVPIEEADT